LNLGKKVDIYNQIKVISEIHREQFGVQCFLE